MMVAIKGKPNSKTNLSCNYLSKLRRRRICKACYGVIKNYLEGNSRKNENYLARFLAFFKTQVGMSLNAEKVMIEMVEDNRTIVNKMVETSAEIDNVIHLLVETKDSRFMDFLGNLCVCDGWAISSTQNLILNKLVYQHREDVLYITAVGGSPQYPEGSKGEVFVRHPGSTSWDVLSDVVDDISIRLYLESQLNLFSRMCWGNNAKIIRALGKELITFEETLLCAKNSTLEPSLRSKYVKLMMVMYVDIDNNRNVLENLPLSFVIKDVTKDSDAEEDTGENEVKALSGAENANFPLMKKWIQEHLKAAAEKKIAASKEENVLLADVIEVLSLLTKFGYYDSLDDIRDLLQYLLEILNGFTDLCDPNKDNEEFTNTTRYKESDENFPIFDIKARIMEVIDLFFNFQSYVRLQRFIRDFRFLNSKKNSSQAVGCTTLEQMASNDTVSEYSTMVQFNTNPSTDFICLLNVLPNTDQDIPKQVTKLIRRRLQFIFSESSLKLEEALFRTKSKDLTFSDILIDVSKYDDPRLLQKSLHLLNRFYSRDLELFTKAIQTQLLVAQESCIVFIDMNKQLSMLREYISVDILELDKAAVEIIRILKLFTRWCHLDDEDEPHSQNQKILYNSGVFSDVLNYVLRLSCSKHNTVLKVTSADPGEEDVTLMQGSAIDQQKALCDGTDSEDDCGVDVETVCVECFKFLKALAKDYLEIQTRLFDFMEDLLDVDIGIASMAGVIAEIFTGKPELCLKLKERHVARIFSLVAQPELSGRSELLYALQAMAKVEKLDLPVKRNQAFIVTYFSKTREKFCSHLLGDDKEESSKSKLSGLGEAGYSSQGETERRGTRAARKELLIKAEEENVDLRLLLSLTDLLASCSDGENTFIKSVCKTVFSMDEMLDILDCDFIVAGRKRPFARFLTFVYMGAHSGSHADFDKRIYVMTMVPFLKKICSYLSNFGKVLKTLPPSERNLVRQGLSVYGRHYSSMHSQKKTRSPRSGSKSVPFITEENGKLLPGVLPYFSDGLLPLLRAYYNNVSFNEAPSGIAIGRETTCGIATALIKMSGALAEYLTTDIQMKLYRGTVLTVLEKCNRELDVDMQVFELKTKSCKGHETSTKDQYNKTYASERKLNETFNTFVTNFKRIYQGPNTIEAQIESSSNSESCYSKDIEPLPLGENFQRQVACFDRSHSSKHSEVIQPHTERLLAQLEYSSSRLNELKEEDRRQQNELDIKCLQLLRALIHNESVKIHPDLKDMKPQLYRDRCRSKVQPIQDSIQGMGNAVSRVLSLLAHPSEEVVCEVLAFLKAMLYSGNRRVQEGMNIVFDTREETLFKIMGRLFQNAAITFEERKHLLRCMEAQQEEERILKKAAHQFNQPYLDVAIIIEGPTTSLKVGGTGTTSVSLLQEEDDELSNPKKDVKDPEADNEEISVTVKPNSKKQVTQSENLELKKLKNNGSAANEQHDDDSKKNQTTNESDVVVKQMNFHQVKLALQVLGLMCDGQYTNMQNYLREQKDNLISVNVVAEVAVFLQNFSLDVDRETMDLVHLTLQTLIEMCVGNYPNQHIIYHKQIIEALNHIFAIQIWHKNGMKYDTLKDSVNLKGSAIELLDVMLEKTSEKSTGLVQDIANNLDIEALHLTLVEFYELMNDRTVKDKGYDDEAEAGLFRTYHALVHLTDYEVTKEKIVPKQLNKPDSDTDSESGNSTNSEDGSDPNDESLYDAWKFCQKWSKSVEVLYKNMNGHQILTKVHFHYNPEQALQEDMIDKIKWSISRDSPEDKLRDLMKWMKAVKRDVMHRAWLQRPKFKLMNIFLKYPLERHRLLVLWSILMSVFTLMAFMIPENLTENRSFTFFNASGAIQPDFLGYWRGAYRPVLYTFGTFHLILSIWMVLEYFIINWPNFRRPKVYYSLKAHLITLFNLLKLRDLTETRAPEELYTDIPIFGLRTIYVVVFLLCSILSLAFDGYFYCICLLHIIVNNDILQRVLKSVTKNGKSLLWVAILGLVVLYIYAVVSFAFLHESFLAPDNDDATLFCSTLYECFASTIRYGLIDNLGLVVPLVPEEFSVSALRLIYDVSFFIIVTTIGLNIVFGIIVDTFSELRDERFRSEEDKKNFCFICSRASHEFERRADGFESHVKNNHNMWNYIYLSIYLDQIDTSDHNAIQKYIYDMIAREKHDFFPLFHALELEKEEDKTKKQLDDLKNMVEKILKRFEEQEHLKSVRSKRQEQMKWEEQNLRSQELSFDAGIPFYRGGAGAQRDSVSFRQLDRHASSPYPALQEISSPIDEL